MSSAVFVVGNTAALVKNGEDSRSTTVMVRAGDTLALQMRSPAAYASSAMATLVIGALKATGTVVTRAQDAAPDAFGFTDLVDRSVDEAIPSESVKIGRFDGPLSAVCGRGCTAIARNVVWGGTSVDGFMEGDTLAIRQISGSAPCAVTSARVTVGSVTSRPWMVATASGVGDARVQEFRAGLGGNDKAAAVAKCSGLGPWHLGSVLERNALDTGSNGGDPLLLIRRRLPSLRLPWVGKCTLDLRQHRVRGRLREELRRGGFGERAAGPSLEGGDHPRGLKGGGPPCPRPACPTSSTRPRSPSAAPGGAAVRRAPAKGLTAGQARRV